MPEPFTSRSLVHLWVKWIPAEHHYHWEVAWWSPSRVDAGLLPMALKPLSSASTQLSEPPRALSHGYKSNTEIGAAIDKSFTRKNHTMIVLCQTLWKERRFLRKHQHGIWEVLVQFSLPRLLGNQGQTNPGHRHHCQVICTSQAAREEQKEAAASLLLLIRITHLSLGRITSLLSSSPQVTQKKWAFRRVLGKPNQEQPRLANQVRAAKETSRNQSQEQTEIRRNRKVQNGRAVGCS